MKKERQFTKQLTTLSAATRYAEYVGGTLQGTAVSFRASYSLSKARYSVKHDKYEVYLRLFPEAPGSVKRLTVAVYSDTSKEAYQKAREIVERGVI